VGALVAVMAGIATHRTQMFGAGLKALQQLALSR
jgi:hypothetical protein